jgi:hypothetical protein
MSWQPILWLVGDWQHADFQEARAWLESTARCTPISPAALNAATCASGVEPSIPPRAIVFAQSRPGRFTAGEVERWHTAAPLARLVVLTGPWCEGEGRTGRPWPGVIRVPWRSWGARLPNVLGLTEGTVRAAWLPRTATEAEHILKNVQEASDPKFRGNADIYTNSLTTFRAWQDLLDRMGLRADRICPGGSGCSNAEIALFVGWESVAGVTGAGENSSSPARVLILDWPRPEDVQRAESLGFCAILAQPLMFGELVASVSNVLAARTLNREAAA